jgi:hypothetical protein
MVAAWGGYVFVLNPDWPPPRRWVGMGQFSDKCTALLRSFFILCRRFGDSDSVVDGRRSSRSNSWDFFFQQRWNSRRG